MASITLRVNDETKTVAVEPETPLLYGLRNDLALEAAAQRAGWEPGAKGDGPRGREFAVSRYKNLGCYCAVVADVDVERKSGRVRVTRVASAVDAGQIVNPDGVVNQIEGGIIQSARWPLKEAVRFDRTRVTTNRPAERFLGVGEGAQGPAAAISIAIAPATGKRLRALPFTPDRVKAALA